MCGVYFSNSNESARFDDNFLIRGPDHFNEAKYDNVSMCLSLLSLTGEFTPQPIEKDGVKLIFNGQIYNYDKKVYLSDSYFVLDEYLEKGIKSDQCMVYLKQIDDLFFSVPFYLKFL